MDKKNLISSILVVDDEEGMRYTLELVLKDAGYRVEVSSSGMDALEKLKKNGFDVVLCDIRMPGIDGLTLLKEYKLIPDGRAYFIMMSAYGDIDTAILAMKSGAYDYISKPFRPDEILLAIRKVEERERLYLENIRLKKEIQHRFGFDNIIGKSPQMRHIFSTIEKIAPYKTSVLLTGESGSGKELIARAIHYNSPRKNNSFVAINCGAIPETLLESELFGYVKGAFTGASKDKKGLFEEADKGTLLLDEVGELPLSLQVKLLRVLEEEKIRRLGDTKSIDIDVRIISASSSDLMNEIKKGRFRKDLFYRLNVVSIRIPPLREKIEDLPLLVDHFIRKFNEKFGKNITGVTPAAMEGLMRYPWPGNIRELENLLERAVLLVDGERIDISNLPQELFGKSSTDTRSYIPKFGSLSIKETTKALEKELIIEALKKTGGNKTKAAALLEISHRALIYKIKEYDIK